MQQICSVNVFRATLMFRPSFITVLARSHDCQGKFIYTKHRSTVLYSPELEPPPGASPGPHIVLNAPVVLAYGNTI